MFGGLDLDLPAGALTVISGPRGSGRSLLLLAMTGRATGITGHLQVAGLDAVARPRRLLRITGVARISTIVDLERRHTIAAAISERAAAEGISRGAARRRYATLAELLELSAPATTVVDELDGYQLTALAVVLAALRDSELVVLDDADRGLDVADQRRLWASLERLIRATGVTVVAATNETHTIPDDAVGVRLPAAGIPAAQHR